MVRGVRIQSADPREREAKFTSTREVKQKNVINTKPKQYLSSLVLTPEIIVCGDGEQLLIPCRTVAEPHYRCQGWPSARLSLLSLALFQANWALEMVSCRSTLRHSMSNLSKTRKLSTLSDPSVGGVSTSSLRTG